MRLLALAALALVALPAAAEQKPAVSDPVLAPFLRYPMPPAQETVNWTGLKFSHKFHRKKKADCTDCHEDVTHARTSAESRIPKEAVCFTCHDPSERPNCAECHEGTPTAAVRPVQEIQFDHAAHLAREGVECTTCHSKAPSSESPSDSLLPTMATCTTCHEHKVDMDRLNCTRCHSNLPEKMVTPSDEAVHGAGFVAMHGAWAAGGSARCAQCHEQSFCSDCHARTTALRPSVKLPDRVDRTFMHRGPFLDRHALEASANPSSCLTCHGQSFCNDCHQSRARALGGGAKASPHPPGYVLPGGTAFHGTDARLNPAACAACHDQGAASNCVTCHKVGGPGGDPHPPGWSRVARDQDRSRSGACIPCHGGAP